MVRFRSFRCIFVHLLIIVDVMRVNSRAVSFRAYEHNGNDTRQAPPYTIAIFKGEHQTPSHTIAVFKPQIPEYTIAAIKPYVNQANLAHDPLIYKPFLQPDQFALVDQHESHEGEVFENDISQPADVANQYYTLDTNQQLFSNLTDDPYSYFPIQEETSDSNFAGYPPAMPPIKNFTGYPNAAYTTPYPVLLTTDLVDLVVPQQQTDTHLVTTKDELYTLYHLGYKFWAKLVKEDCSDSIGLSLQNELPAIRTLPLSEPYHVCQQITQLTSSRLFFEAIVKCWKWSKLIPAGDGEFRGRSVITQAIWNIPLFFYEQYQKYNLSAAVVTPRPDIDHQHQHVYRMKNYFPYAIRTKPRPTHPNIDRFNPHVKKPPKDNFFLASEPKPESSVFVEQVLQSPTQYVAPQIVDNELYHGYYANPSYVTFTPVTFTTSVPVVSEDPVQPYTYYHIGSKFWYLPLYVMFAFVVLYGYLIIVNAVFRKWTAVKISRNNDIIEATEYVLSAIEKASEMMSREIKFNQCYSTTFS